MALTAMSNTKLILMSLPRMLAGVLTLCGATGCSPVGLGRIQPRHVEGAWTFRTADSPARCGIDSLAVHLRDGDRTWGGFFLSGDARPNGHSCPPLQISHGRVHPNTGAFKLVFSDHESLPERTRQFALEGTFDESGGATVNYVRYLPGPECIVEMNGRRER